MSKIRFLTAVAFVLATGAMSVHAHDDAYLDTQQAPHGGQLRMAGAYHLELVVDKSTPQAADKPVVVYVTDHAGQKVSTEGATGTPPSLPPRARPAWHWCPTATTASKAPGAMPPPPT